MPITVKTTSIIRHEFFFSRGENHKPASVGLLTTIDPGYRYLLTVQVPKNLIEHGIFNDLLEWASKEGDRNKRIVVIEQGMQPGEYGYDNVVKILTLNGFSNMGVAQWQRNPRRVKKDLKPL